MFLKSTNYKRKDKVQINIYSPWTDHQIQGCPCLVVRYTTTSNLDSHGWLIFSKHSGTFESWHEQQHSNTPTLQKHGRDRVKSKSWEVKIHTQATPQNLFFPFFAFCKKYDHEIQLQPNSPIHSKGYALLEWGQCEERMAHPIPHPPIHHKKSPVKCG